MREPGIEKAPVLRGDLKITGAFPSKAVPYYFRTYDLAFGSLSYDRLPTITYGPLYPHLMKGINIG